MHIYTIEIERNSMNVGGNGLWRMRSIIYCDELSRRGSTDEGVYEILASCRRKQDKSAISVADVL